MNSGNGYDEYDEIGDWDEWAEEAFKDYQDPGDPLFPPKNPSNNLPAKIPGKNKVNLTKKHKWQLPLDWDYKPDDKAKKMREELEKLKQERILRRTEEAKSISWKTIVKGDEYEVIVGGESLGRVRSTIRGKWKIHPSFTWKDTYAKRIIVDNEYTSFHDSGHALVDLWIVS